LYRPEVLNELLKESDFVVSRRKEVAAMVQALDKAEEYVSCLVLNTSSCRERQDCCRRLISTVFISTGALALSRYTS
jgi:dynamin 1-like protein